MKKINNLDKAIINKLLNDFSSFFNVDFNKINWTKRIPCTTKKNSMYLNEYKNNYYHRKSFNQIKNEVIYESIIKIDLEHITLKHDVGARLRNSFLKFEISQLNGKIKNFEFKLSGYDVEILYLLNNYIYFPEKEKVKTIINNYYDILVATVDKSEYPYPFISGSVSFIFDVENNTLNMIRLKESHTGFVQVRNVSSQYFYPNIISDYIREFHDFSLKIDLKNLSINSVKLDNLKEKNSLFDNLIDVLTEQDVKETISYLEMINY